MESERDTQHLEVRDVVMYILINVEAKMDKGKIAGQAAHSACSAVQILERRDFNPEYEYWCAHSYPKIVLKATLDQMTNLIYSYSDVRSKIWCVHTRDLGKTQIAAGTLTSIAFCPMERSETPIEIKSLKLM